MGKKVIMQTNFGDIQIELNEEKAPISCRNFERYVKDDFYVDTLFHRVIDGFMVQGGGFDSKMNKKETYSCIENEADNGLLNEIGSIAMARTMDPHSASSQFFINVGNNTFLNHVDKTQQGWGYSVFGKVIDGMKVVDKIRVVKTSTRSNHQDVPIDDVVIEKITCVE
jgi:peptidyl-prolyl cis-trans isomerase B (cyclophilin B)